MSIWEEIYAKHAKNKNAPVDPREVDRLLSDSMNRQAGDPSAPSLENLYQQTGDRGEPPPLPPANGSEGSWGAASLEEMYHRPGDPPPTAPPPRETPETRQATAKQLKSRFMPRAPGQSKVPYPAVLGKLRYSLSDSWANILVETKQTVSTLLVCGAGRKEGATFVSYHLALFLSKEYNMKVLYMDTNLNHATVPRTQNLPGLYSFVAEKRDLASLVVQTEYPGFYLLPSGSGKVAKSIGANVLSREPIDIILAFCKSAFDVTIIDGQPLASSPVMIELARAVDMTLLVCRYGFSRQEVSKLAVEKLQKYGVSSVGVIMNDRKYPIPQKLYRLMG